jgi:D-lactate dehydrogenase
MALITIYNQNPADQQQYEELFAGSEHHIEYVAEPLSFQNSNPRAEVIAISARDKITPEILQALPELRLIATISTGFDHIDMAAAKARSVTVVNVPRYGEQTVAEFTFALILALSRRIAGSAHSAAFAGDVNYDRIIGFDLAGKTLGLIGAGRIGQHVAKMAQGFDMHVVAYDPYPNSDKAQECGFTYVTLQELTAQSDVISLHAPATPQNHHLVDSALLAGVKSGAVLVNTARGELIDLPALADAMEQGIIARSGLDVLDHEALLKQNLEAIIEDTTHPHRDIAEAIFRLKRTRDVIITPHNAYNTVEATLRRKQATVQNILDFYKGDTPNKVEV